MKVLFTFPTYGWMLRLEWKPTEFWVGVRCYNHPRGQVKKATPNRIDIWICLIPCLPLHYASPVAIDGV